MTMPTTLSPTPDVSPVRYERGDDGIAVLTLDDPEHSANTMSTRYVEAMDAALDRLAAEADQVTGVIVTSAKRTFFAGANLDELIQAGPQDAAALAANSRHVKAQLRRLETLGRPVVAALNGTALGGGFEIALACHYRVIADLRGVKVGFPEVTLGLLPGAGGVVRTVRMLGIADAVTKVLGQGTQFSPTAAKEMGLVDEVVSSVDELLPAARAWIAEHPQSVQRWDVKGYRIPGGTPSTPALAQMLPAFPANLRKQLKGAPMPAPLNILSAAVEGAQVDVDTAFEIETSYFVDLAVGQVAKNMTGAFFFDLQAVNGGASRPAGQPEWQATKVGVLGAGMMGAGIAYAFAKVGVDVVLRDISIEAAQKGRAYSETIVSKAVGKGRLTKDKAGALVARITPTTEMSDLDGCDLVVEAVFEDPALKKSVFAEVGRHATPDALLASNTSTLPITDLANGVSRQEDFVGLHFFSPVDKMPLVEIVKGDRTSDATLARAFDVVRQLGKTPIVVNDSRGFFTSRVIGTFVNEAVAMLAEGIAPSTIEQATTQAGYPVGALQLADELNLELFLKIRNETREAMGDAYRRHPAEDVVEKMVELGRPGRLKGAGFFDYDDAGKRTGLWPGLTEHFPLSGDPSQVDLHELEERMLIIEAIESARCVEENVLITTADANIGSIMGIGFPPWTGGVLQYINGYEGSTGTGIAAFVERAEQFTKAHGERFAPNALLRTKAEQNEKF